MPDPSRSLNVTMVDECSDRVDMLDHTLTAIGYCVVARVNPGDDLYVAFER